MKKILILIMSSPLIKPYDELMKKQKETWDSVYEDRVQTIYYYANPNIESDTFLDKNLILKMDENVDNNTIKFKNTLKHVINYDWDYIFRSNASSYIDKKRLLNFAEQLPTEKCYCGLEGNYDNITYASGCGYFISRDVTNCLINKIDDSIKFVYEDVHTGEILQQCGIPLTKGATRVDYDHNQKIECVKKLNITDTYPYHYRCKSNDNNRNKDLDAFDAIFNYLKKENL